MRMSDMRHVDWGATAKLAAVRGVAGALIVTLIGLFFGAFAAGGLGQALLFFAMWSVGGTLGGVVYLAILRAVDATLGRVIGIVSLVTALLRFAVTLMVAAGDPLVYILNRQRPEILDLADFKIVNLVAVIFVRKHGAPALEG